MIDTAITADEAVKVSPLRKVRNYIAGALLSVAFVVAAPLVANASADPTLGDNVDDFSTGITSTFLTVILPAVFTLGLLFVGASIAWKWMRRAAKSS